MAVRGRDSRPLFQFAEGLPLTKQRLVHHLHKVLSEVGIDTANYTGYSFCTGVAMSAAAMGIGDFLIQTLG